MSDADRPTTKKKREEPERLGTVWHTKYVADSGRHQNEGLPLVPDALARGSKMVAEPSPWVPSQNAGTQDVLFLVRRELNIHQRTYWLLVGVHV